MFLAASLPRVHVCVLCFSYHFIRDSFAMSKVQSADVRPDLG